MEIFFIRHGQTRANVNGELPHPNDAMTLTGRKQVKKSVDEFILRLSDDDAGEKISPEYSIYGFYSTDRRCRETIDIFQEKKVEFHVLTFNENLRERRTGLEGKSLRVIADQESEENIVHTEGGGIVIINRSEQFPDLEETIPEAAERARRALLETLPVVLNDPGTLKEKIILYACHGMLGKLVIGALLNWGWRKAINKPFTWDNAGLVEISEIMGDELFRDNLHVLQNNTIPEYRDPVEKDILTLRSYAFIPGNARIDMLDGNISGTREHVCENEYFEFRITQDSPNNIDFDVEVAIIIQKNNEGTKKPYFLLSYFDDGSLTIEVDRAQLSQEIREQVDSDFPRDNPTQLRRQNTRYTEDIYSFTQSKAQTFHDLITRYSDRKDGMESFHGDYMAMPPSLKNMIDTVFTKVKKTFHMDE